MGIGEKWGKKSEIIWQSTYFLLLGLWRIKGLWILALHQLNFAAFQERFTRSLGLYPDVQKYKVVPLSITSVGVLASVFWGFSIVVCVVVAWRVVG